MALEELNEKLHGRDIHLDRARPHTAFDPGQIVVDPHVSAQFKKTEEWQAPVAEESLSTAELAVVATREHRWRKWVAIGFGGIALLAFALGIVYKIHAMLFDETRVVISITGPKDVASVEETTFTVAYSNKNWAGLANATLVFSYPDSFHLQAGNSAQIKGSLAEIPLGEIKANTEGKILVTGKFYGSKGDLVPLKATLRYSPKNVATVFEKTAQFVVNVGSSPLSFEITAPLELATGQDVVYVVDYANKSDVSFPNLRVKMEYPDGFQFVSSEPKPSEGQSVWYVGNFDAQANGKITIRGVLSGAREEHKSVQGMIGFFQGEGKFVAYAENERQTRIIASPLSISQTVNGLTDIAVNQGNTLRYVIRFRNDGDVGVRDAIVTVDIDPTMLDMSRLTPGNGAYDAARKVIIWKASGVSSLGKLEPGAEGEVSFSVPVAEKIVVTGEKNISVKTVARIDSLDIPTPIGSNKIISSNTLYVKLKSAVGISTAVLYTDTLFPNSGPVPPKVGELTSYTIHLSVTNSLNDLRQTRISAILPTGVHYSGKYAKTEETVTFNERSNELVWELGTFAATEGKPREIVFQVSVTPSPDQVGERLVLVSNMVFTAQDTFTNQEIRIEKDKQDNFLSGDTVYNSSFNGNVSVVQRAD
ncbi:MAG: hypothetical protein Q7S04_04805 [Candidatus Moranbacteria bacterium]|nr:hypothetical protein [Candidatus Moranbacteria bacterium]